MKRILIIMLALATGALQAQQTGLLGQLVKWDQITGQPEWLLKPVTVTRGDSLVSGGAVQETALNEFKVYFNPGGGGSGGASISGALAVEAGMVAPWAGSGESLPDGWLLCDGATYGTNEWPELYAAVGRTYTAPAVDASQFAVPDYRGRTLEGAAAPGNADPHIYPEGYAFDARVGPLGAPGASQGVGSVNPGYWQVHGIDSDQSSVPASQAVLWLIKGRTNPEGAVTAGAVDYGDYWGLTNHTGVMVMTVNTNALGGGLFDTNKYTIVIEEGMYPDAYQNIPEMGLSARLIDAHNAAGWEYKSAWAPAKPYHRILMHETYVGEPNTSGGDIKEKYLRVRIRTRSAGSSGDGAVRAGTGSQIFQKRGDRGVSVLNTLVIPPNQEVRAEWWVSTPNGQRVIQKIAADGHCYRFPKYTLRIEEVSP